MKRVLYLTLAIILVAAIIAMIGRKTTTKIADNYSEMNNHSYPMVVDTTDHLYVYDITDCRMDLACGQMPDSLQENIILCTAAAFTGKCLDHFEYTNILGSYISNGVLYKGYTEDKDGIPYEERYALFVWNGKDSQGNMLKKGIYPIPNHSILEQATQRGGMAFTQHWVIKEGQVFTPTIQKLDEVNIFRAMCLKNNRFYVIESREKVTYNDFLQSLISFGVENALYMDMGRGWNHAFYRDSNNQLHILHPHAHNYCTNWIVVYRD